MADIYGSHFEYGGVSSRMYGLLIANMNTSRNLRVSGTINGVTINSKREKKRYLIDDSYSDFPISFDVEILTIDDHGFEMNERREIEKWLFNKHDYRKLYIDYVDDPHGEFYEVIDGEQKRLYLNCRFMNPERIEHGGKTIGYKATLEADSGLWWQDAVTKSFALNPSDNTRSITVSVDTDLDDYIYPKVTIHMGSSGGDVTITNTTDSNTRLTKFIGLSASTNVILKGDINYVSGQNYSKFYKMNFPRLVDGDNVFTIMGNVASIDFEFCNRRML